MAELIDGTVPLHRAESSMTMRQFSYFRD